jgi:hypothetical protein
MMTAATKNARIRAKQIASHGNCGVKELRFARMGLIRAACRSTDSTATSWEGKTTPLLLRIPSPQRMSATFSLKQIGAPQGKTPQ